MTDPAAAAAAGILTNMRGDNDDDKQAKKTKRKEAMDTLCAKRKARKAEERKRFFSSPMERLELEAPTSLSKPCQAAIEHCKRAKVALPPSLISNPNAQMPDPLSMPGPMVAPVEDDTLLMEWPGDDDKDPERALDNTDFPFFDDVEVDPFRPGDRKKQLGWYCFARKLPASSIRKKPKNKKRVVMTGKINIKKAD